MHRLEEEDRYNWTVSLIFRFCTEVLKSCGGLNEILFEVVEMRELKCRKLIPFMKKNTQNRFRV